MTNSYNYGASEQQAAEGLVFDSANKPLPKYFVEVPVNYQITNNEYTSAPYYYDLERNTWIFYKPGTQIPSPPLDPDAGNLWIDASNAYLMYVFNVNEMTFPDAVDNRWYALTTNKRAYDYLILPIVSDGDDVDTLVPPDRVNIFKQSWVYFNKLDMDIKIKVPEEGGLTSAWQSITQRSIEAVSDPDADFNDVLPASALRQLQSSTNSLQQRVDALVAATS